MQNSFSFLRPGRQGMGVVFFIAMGMIVVLAVMVGGNQIMSLSSQTRDATSAVELGRKANLVVESAVEESVYYALSADLNRFDNTNGLYDKLRQFTGQTPVKADQKLLDGAEPFVSYAEYPPAITYGPLGDDEDLRLHQTNPKKNPVFYGVLEQKPFPGNVSQSNESQGLLGFAHSATVKATGIFRDVDRVAQFAKQYKAIHVGAPWPFSQFTLFIRNDRQILESKYTTRLRDETERVANPANFQNARKITHSRFAEFGFIHNYLVEAIKAYNAETDTNPKLAELPRYPLAEYSVGPVVCTSAELKPEDWVFDAYRAATDPAQGYMPLDANSADPKAAGVLAAMKNTNGGLAATISAAVANRLSGDGFRFRNLSEKEKKDFFQDDSADKAYDSLQPEVFFNKATHRYRSSHLPSGQLEERFKALHVEDGDTLKLRGVYYFTDPITLNWRFKGKGVIYCLKGIKIQKFEKADPGDDSHACIISNEDIDLTGVSTEIHADLMAPRGTLEDWSGKTIKGSVMVNHLVASQGATLAKDDIYKPGPKIERPPGWEYVPWAPTGSSYSREMGKHIEVFVDPGYVKKLYWARREYQR